jgi:DNA-binding NarL/FixJ family response regulator
MTETPSTTPETTPGKLRVLLVDDHPLVRDWLKNLLQMEPDLEVIGEADSPATALAAIAQNMPDIAVVDLSLKRSSGLDLIKQLAIRHPDIRVLVLSMHEEISDVQRALRAGARGYVMKGESSHQIVPAIRWVHAGKIYATPEVFSKLAERMTGQGGSTVANPEEILSDRELDVFRRIGEGQTTRRIADELHVSQKTVQTYCARIKEKIGLDDGTELALTAIRWRESNRF